MDESREVRTADASVVPSKSPRRALATRRPLAPGIYLIRNIGKSAPLAAVIMLAVLLVAGVISMIDSIPYSIRTIYGYSRQMLGVSPRGDPTLTPKILDDIKRNSPVPIERVMNCRVSTTQIQSIVGKWPFYVLGLGQDDMAYYLKRQGSDGLNGRLPKPGKPEVLVSETVARNLNLKLGSVLLGPDKDMSWSPYDVRVVGIAHTESWLIVNSIEYQRDNYFPPVDLGMVFAKDLHNQNILDHWAVKHFKGQRAAAVAYFQIEKDTDTMFKTLFEILNVVIGTLVIVITFMMGTLMNIYQTQRLVEFGLLQAIGYTKKNLIQRVMAETVCIVLIGWALGIGLSLSLLNVVKSLMMDPHAYALDIYDPIAYRYTIPLPVMILLVATLTVTLRFRKFDPVGVVERRLV